MVLIRIPLPGPEKASEAIAAPPGNDVNVEVGTLWLTRLLMATNVPSAFSPSSTAPDNIWRCFGGYGALDVGRVIGP